MERFKIIKSAQNENEAHKICDDVIIHKNILDILFKHKEEVHRKLVDLRGTFLIDHIAIKIIDPNNNIVIFSITPSVEYNLLIQGLWKYDHGFSTNFQKKNAFYIWEKAYCKKYFNEIKYIKEQKHRFSFGFNISKEVDAFTLIYSFATRSKNSNLHDYYCNLVNELYELGDYGYKLIQNLYAYYCNPIFQPPSMTYKQNHPTKPILRLVANINDKTIL